MRKEKQIDDLFRIWQEGQGAGGQLVVSYKGERLERCYGYQNIETGTPITQQSVFHLASMSKQITGMCICMLYEQGKLSLDDDVRQYLPDLVHVPEPITITHLLHHTSGLPDHYGFFFLTGRSKLDTATQAEILRLNSRTRKLNFEPGEEYSYSNPNYTFMAMIVERITGEPFWEFCRKNIFEPLGMTHTQIRHDPEMLIPNRVNSYMDDGYTYRNGIFNLCMYGATGVQSTASDMEIYLHQYTNPTLIRRDTLENVLLKPGALNNGKAISYAGGVFVEQLEGHRIIHHGGVNAGFRTMGLCMPDDDLYIVLLSNTHNIAIEAAARDIARLVLDLPARGNRLTPYVTETVDENQIEGYYYGENILEGFSITRRDGVVYCGQTPLIALGGNCFKQGRLDVTFTFGEQPMLYRNGGLIPLTRHTEHLSAAQAQAYVGNYECRDYESHWQVLWEEDQLWLYHLRHGRMPLYWLGGDRFCGDLARYDFHRDAQGRVIGVNRATTRQRYMLFHKTEAAL